jgi:SAM-dependent methyltransferase
VQRIARIQEVCGCSSQMAGFRGRSADSGRWTRTGVQHHRLVIVPDTKDWMWVLEDTCPECGYVAAHLDRTEIGRLVRDDAVGWTTVLAQPDARRRPDDSTWSPLEYACHVRDVHDLFAQRLTMMLRHDDPTFPNWDQDVTAVEKHYESQDPVQVAGELHGAAHRVADVYDSLRDAPEETWARRGFRDNGSEFTIDSIARYHLHDVLHHTYDVRGLAASATVSAYDVDAASYSDATWEVDEGLRADLDAFAAAVGPGGLVLEIGSAGGRDALELEARGLTVRRSDVTPAFVELMRSRGHESELLDPLTDELGGPHDGVWANASLLHVARPDLPTVLRRLAAATRPGGVLVMSLKEGDGEGWSTHGNVRAPRRFVHWREAPLRAVLSGARWRVDEVRHELAGNGQPWLTMRAVRF